MGVTKARLAREDWVPVNLPSKYVLLAKTLGEERNDRAKARGSKKIGFSGAFSDYVGALGEVAVDLFFGVDPHWRLGVTYEDEQASGGWDTPDGRNIRTNAAGKDLVLNAKDAGMGEFYLVNAENLSRLYLVGHTDADEALAGPVRRTTAGAGEARHDVLVIPWPLLHPMGDPRCSH